MYLSPKRLKTHQARIDWWRVVFNLQMEQIEYPNLVPILQRLNKTYCCNNTGINLNQRFNSSSRADFCDVIFFMKMTVVELEEICANLYEGLF